MLRVRGWSGAAAALIIILVKLMSRHTSEKTSTTLRVYVYDHDWCRIFHAGAILRMCDDFASMGGAVTCVVIDDEEQVGQQGHVSGQGDTFAVPVIEYGDTRISQSVAATAFVGDTLGFAAEAPFKAVQYMLDMRDFLSNTDPNIEALDVEKFDDLVQSGRVDEWLGQFERSIVGPYYFGAPATYVDYYLWSIMRWLTHRLEGKKVFPGLLLKNFTKVDGVLRAIGR